LSDYEHLIGNIIIDYDVTKLLDEFIPNPQEDAIGYIQNIAIVTGQYEKTFLNFWLEWCKNISRYFILKSH
jgi:hypothetical protein